jgi:hypothetical protein
MKKYKNKLTPDAHKQLKALAMTLGTFQKRDDNGALMYRKKTVFNGREFDDKKRLWVNKYTEIKEPQMVNHLVSLIEIYRVDGQMGVDMYAKFFLDLKEEQKGKPVVEKLEPAK